MELRHMFKTFLDIPWQVFTLVACQMMLVLGIFTPSGEGSL